VPQAPETKGTLEMCPIEHIPAASTDAFCDTPIIASQHYPELLPELTGIAESSIFAPLRRFEMNPIPIGTWPISSSEVTVDTGLGLVITIDRHFDKARIETAWPGASEGLTVLKQAGFAPDTVRRGQIMGLDLPGPIPILLAAKSHPRLRQAAIWIKVEIDLVPIAVATMSDYL
jgi:hypothetical protein